MTIEIDIRNPIFGEYPLDLDTLANGIGVISEEAAGFYKENCIVCLDNQGHRSGVTLAVLDGINTKTLNVKLVWSGSVTPSLRRAYNDLRRATDNAACAIALLLVREITELTAIEQAAIGTTVDYFLSEKTDEETLIFNFSARLEVSGILKESESNTTAKRVKQKINRLQSNNSLPTLIIVVEFGTPKCEVVGA